MTPLEVVCRIVPESLLLPTYEICFRYRASFEQPLVVGDAVRWAGPELWRVEAVVGDRVTVKLWPDDLPYPDVISTYGPGEWPGQNEVA